MILVHLVTNNKVAAISKDTIIFMEEMEDEIEDKKVLFTRVYLKDGLGAADAARIVDVKERVETLQKKIR